MRPRLLAFTRRGHDLAQTLAERLGGEASRCGRGCTLESWTAEGFRSGAPLIFVGAVGIAVRAIAPFVKSKASDPAVVAVDEGGSYAIPLLSGHLGGANDLARQIAAVSKAQAVITTATDVRGCFPEGEGCDVEVSCRSGDGAALRLVPPAAVLGVGCRRGTSLRALEAAFEALLAREELSPLAVKKVCSIDLKQGEPGLLAFCDGHSLPLETCSAGELAAVPGEFPASDFVQRVTGVGNVCQRSAVLGSGGGALLGEKYQREGVTMALAMGEFPLDWRIYE